MAWQTPKTDFTISDYYNYGDINRVENNIDAVADLIETYTTRPTLDTIKTDWANTDIVFYDQINKIENNILAIKNETAEPFEWIAPVVDWISIDIFDYVDANRLESNLLALYTMINNIIDAFLYCGTFYCGQDNTEL
jgi:hypothetical protein